MPSTLRTGTRRRRNNLIHLDLCFSNFTHPFIHESPPRRPTSTSSSLHHDHHIINHNRPSASTTTTTTTTTTSMIKNFNTLYDHTTELEPDPEPADFATAFASQRFFFSSPGRSNSIVESTPPSSSSSSSPSLSSSLTATAPPPPESSAASSSDDNNNNESKVVLFEGSVAVPTYSPDPYVDFRRSMQEMVEARPELMVDMKSNWHVLHELLLCYLALNPKTAHKFIFGAFADLLVTLMALSSSCSCSCSSSPSLPPENPDPDEVAGGDGGC